MGMKMEPSDVESDGCVGRDEARAVPGGEQALELAIEGMTCATCATEVRRALEALPGVRRVEVRFAAERALIRLDPAQVDLSMIQRAVEAAGYRLGAPSAAPAAHAGLGGFTRSALTLLGVAFGVVLFVTVIGEALGLFAAVTERVPWPAWLALILVGGYPIFVGVTRSALKGRVTSHTLMTLGLLAAVAVGEWVAALLVVFFIRLGEYVESFTSERARRAVKDLTAMAPQTARVERDGQEVEVPVSTVRVGDVVVVRPGDQIPVDGEVLSGQATVNQSAITGESMPVEVGPGARVFAASFASLGGLRVRATAVGSDSTFGRVIKLVEEAEVHRAEVQRLADRFSGYYLPVVATVAALTFLLSRNAIATAAVLVVACSCSFALATPIAVIASIGAAAKRGLLIKGGKYLEALARADVLLLDKTGTLTLGRPQLTDVVALSGQSPEETLGLAAAAERYSEHPLAEAVRAAAEARGLALATPEQFEAIPGLGVRARVGHSLVAVGSYRLVENGARPAAAVELERQGKTLLFVAREGELVGVLAAADTLRPEVPAALAEVRRLGIRHIELLTGDNERAAAAIAERLGVAYRANLLPEEKIAIVKEYQAQGHTVVMVGDGVNDAPALAQANVGIAMGVAGTPVALEAAHVALMREDWALVPEVFRIARRTVGVVKLNLGFTAVYNLVGLTLAALGLLPLALAAAAQSLPDIGILGNSSRLLRQGSHRDGAGIR
jgi:Cu+-exporting ATPase